MEKLIIWKSAPDDGLEFIDLDNEDEGGALG